MKYITAIFFAAAVSVVGFSIDANAQGRINNRQHKQQKRIVQGVKSGELTAREVYRLERRQLRINRTEDRFRDSGKGLTWRERYILEQRQDRASRSIYRQKHDRQDYDRRKRRY
jgi:hypothetical protein